MNRTITFATAALACAFMAGPALSQASDSAPSLADELPSVTQSDSESTAAIRLQSLSEERAGGFFMDETMAELRPESENRAYFETLTPEERAALRAECQETGADMTGAMADLCVRVGAF